MPNIDRLFQLIQALNPAEKSHFTKYAQLSTRNRPPSYVRLYEAIERLEVYEEKSFVRRHRSQDFVNNLARNKKYLRSKILESLWVLHTGEKAQKILGVLPILFEKELFEEAKQQLKIAIRAAEKMENYTILLKLTRWEFKLLLRKQDKETERRVQTLIQKEKKYLKILEWEVEARHLKIQLGILQRSDLLLQKIESQKQLEVIMQSALMQESVEVLPFHIQTIIYQIKNLYFRYSTKNKDLEKAYAIAQKDALVYEAQHKLSKQQIGSYKRMLCGLVKVCNQTKRFEEAGHVIEKIHQLRKPNQKEKIKDFEIICSVSLRHAMLSGDFEMAVKIAEEIESKWESLSQILEHGKQLYYCYNILIIYFVLENLEEANSWLTRILNFGKADQGREQIHTARILRLPIYYDLNFKDLDKHIESSARTLRNNDYWDAYVQLIHKRFAQLTKVVDQKEVISIIQKMKTEIKSLPMKQPPLGMHEILLWCESKISGRSLKSIFEQKRA